MQIKLTITYKSIKRLIFTPNKRFKPYFNTYAGPKTRRIGRDYYIRWHVMIFFFLKVARMKFIYKDELTKEQWRARAK